MSTSKTTTIRVRVETYEELSKQGTVVDSFDSVIKRLLNDNNRIITSIKGDKNGKP